MWGEANRGPTKNLGATAQPAPPPLAIATEFHNEMYQKQTDVTMKRIKNQLMSQWEVRRFDDRLSEESPLFKYNFIWRLISWQWNHFFVSDTGARRPWVLCLPHRSFMNSDVIASRNFRVDSNKSGRFKAISRNECYAWLAYLEYFKNEGSTKSNKFIKCFSRASQYYTYF